VDASRRTAIPAYIHLLRAKDRIDAGYADPLSVPDLARTALASPAHFTRSFKRAFGETPHQYLLRRRVERAKDLLRSTDLTVTQVSLEVGFTSPGTFATAFRELVGETPTTYRRRVSTEPADVPACFTLMWSRPTGRAVFPKPADGDRASVRAFHDTEVRSP
jgi:AraC-like DNA-binding protein